MKNCSVTYKQESIIMLSMVEIYDLQNLSESRYNSMVLYQPVISSDFSFQYIIAIEGLSFQCDPYIEKCIVAQKSIRKFSNNRSIVKTMTETKENR